MIRSIPRESAEASPTSIGSEASVGVDTMGAGSGTVVGGRVLGTELGPIELLWGAEVACEGDCEDDCEVACEGDCEGGWGSSDEEGEVVLCQSLSTITVKKTPPLSERR